MADSNNILDDKEALITQLEDLKIMKDYVRDQMKFDLDTLQHAISYDLQAGTVVRLSAIKRAIEEVDPDKKEA
jgi:hypothetical protein